MASTEGDLRSQGMAAASPQRRAGILPRGGYRPGLNSAGLEARAPSTANEAARGESMTETSTSRLVIGLLLCMAATAAQAVSDDGLLFYCPFDGTVEATVARGGKSAKHAIAPQFQSGVRGQAIVIGGTPKAGQRIVDGTPVSAAPVRNCYYSPSKSIDLQRGSVSFWLKLLDWSGTDKSFNVIFYTHAGRNYFQIYKYWSDDRFLFLRGAQDRWTSTEFRIRNWRPGQWHHVVATWSAVEMRMFIDGHLVCARRVRFPLENATLVEPFSVGPGGSWEKAFIGHSLVDELRIHRRPLSRGEVAELYLRDASSVELDAGLITIGERTPKHDGRIEDFEYAFDSTGLAASEESISVERSRYALSYDRTNLYVAVLSRLDSPKRSAGPSGRVELLLCPGQATKRMRRFVFTPVGGLAGRRDSDAVRVQNTVTKATWLLEAAIPFAALGHDGAPTGQKWRMNLVRDHTSTKETVSLAPVIGPVDDRSHFVTLAFRAESPSIRIANWRDKARKRCGSDVSVQRAGSRSDLRLDIVSNTTEKYGLKSRSYPLFSQGKPTPYRSPAWRTGLRDFSLNETRIVEVLDGSETPLYVRESTYESRTPLKVFFLYTQDKKRLFVSALRRADGKIQARFLEPNGTCAFRASRTLPVDASYLNATFALDFDVLVPGYYTVKIDHVAPDGVVTETWEQDYRVPAADAPDLRPYVDEEADHVPAPWTPVEVDTASRVSTWGRTYDFARGFMFSSLVSQGTEILAAPATLRLNGKTLSPAAPVEVGKRSVSDMLAEWSKTAKLSRLNVDSRISVHFDGYCEIAMTLVPTAATPEVATLSLDIPLRGEVATLVRDNKLSRLVKGKSGAVGEYWYQDLTGRPFLWVGNEWVGLNWLAPSLDGWHNKRNSRRVELIRQGDRVILRLNLVDAPTELDAPRTIRFGFTLTPSRPLDRKILRLRSGKDMRMWCQPWKYFAVPDYDTANRATIARASKGAAELFLYFGVSLTSPFSPEWPWFAQEWRGTKKNFGEWTGNFNDPAIRNRCTYVGAPLRVDSFFNWMQHKRQAFFQKAKTPLTPKARNYYFDTGPSVSARYREQAINVYRMIRRTGPDAKIWTHQGWQRVMPMQHFTDIIVGGEGVGSQVGQKGNYYDLLTPEMFRATFSSYIWGIKMAFLDMTVRALRENHPARAIAFSLDDPESRRAMLHSYGYCVVHDVDIYDHQAQTQALRDTIWAAQDALGWDERIEFHPYWADDAVKLVSPDSTRIMASAYTRNGKMLLGVLNDTDPEQEVELALDLDKLGVTAGIRGHDVWQPERVYALSPRWKDRVPRRGFRLVLWE